MVLNGHAHNYQRYAALSPTGAADPVNGITEYVAGTGGEELISVKPITGLSRVLACAFGYLRLTRIRKAGISSSSTCTSVIDSSTGAPPSMT